jgi:GntR family transcriptional regulator
MLVEKSALHRSGGSNHIELQINPSTAQKVMAHLLAAGLLEHRVGAGSMVAKGPEASKAEKAKLLEGQLEELAVEQKRLGIELVDMQEAIAKILETFERR